MIKLILIFLQSVAADPCKSYVSISDLVTNDQCQAKCTTSHDCIQQLESQSNEPPSLRSSTSSTPLFGPWDDELLPLECGFGYVLDIRAQMIDISYLYKISPDGTYSDILPEGFRFPDFAYYGAIGFDKATGALFGIVNDSYEGTFVFALGYGEDGSTIELRQYDIQSPDGALSMAGACSVFNPGDGSAGYYFCCSNAYQCGGFRLSDTKGPNDPFVFDYFEMIGGSLPIWDLDFHPDSTNPAAVSMFAVGSDGELLEGIVNFEAKEFEYWNRGILFYDDVLQLGRNRAESQYFDNDRNLIVHLRGGAGIGLPFPLANADLRMEGFSTFSLPTGIEGFSGASCPIPTATTTTTTTTGDPVFGPWDDELLPLECGFGYVIDVSPSAGNAQKLYKISPDGTYSDILSGELSFDNGWLGGIGFDKATGAIFGINQASSTGTEAFAIGYGEDGSTIKLRKYNIQTANGSLIPALSACTVFNPQDGSAGYYFCCVSGEIQCGFYRLSDTKGPQDNFVWYDFTMDGGFRFTIGDLDFHPDSTDPTAADFFAVNTSGDVMWGRANFETKEAYAWNSGWITVDGHELIDFTAPSAYFDNDRNLILHTSAGTGIAVPMPSIDYSPYSTKSYTTFSIPTSMGDFDAASCPTPTTTTPLP